MSQSSQAPVNKLGLFGGSFDPVHHGHLIIAEWLYSTLKLDRVIFIPVFKHPFDEKRKLSAAEHRLQMLKRALRPFEAFQISDYEIGKGGVSYTFDTLQHFKTLFPQATLYFFIGGDNLSGFRRWKNYLQLLDLAIFTVYDRPGGKLPEGLPSDRFLFVKAPLIEISSSLIRERLRQNLPCQSLMPIDVWQYIQQHGLYQHPK